MGFTWLILGPLLMVVLYTLIFSQIIGLRFQHTDSVSNFGLYVYCGLLPFLAFSETLIPSVKSIRSNAGLVQRVVFPLEILPISMASTAYITQFFGFGVLIILVALLEHGLHWTLLLLPIVAVPQLLFLLGLSYLASVAGAYLPDLREVVQALVRALLFALPIFWPPDRIPDSFRFIVDYNPLAFLVIAYRNLVLEGRLPDVTLLLWFTLFATALMVAGLALFLRAKKRFADLI